MKTEHITKGESRYFTADDFLPHFGVEIEINDKRSKEIPNKYKGVIVGIRHGFVEVRRNNNITDWVNYNHSEIIITLPNNESGLTTRQLLEQRNKLLEALNDIKIQVGGFEPDDWYGYGVAKKVNKIIKQAIQNTK